MPIGRRVHPLADSSSHARVEGSRYSGSLGTQRRNPPPTIARRPLGASGRPRRGRWVASVRHRAAGLPAASADVEARHETDRVPVSRAKSDAGQDGEVIVRPGRSQGGAAAGGEDRDSASAAVGLPRIGRTASPSPGRADWARRRCPPRRGSRAAGEGIRNHIVAAPDAEREIRGRQAPTEVALVATWRPS